MKKPTLVAIVVGILVAGCGSSTRIKDVECKAVMSIGPNQEAKPVQFKKIVIKLPRGAKIGSVQGGVLCVKQSSLVWQGGRMTLSGEEFTEVFRDELEKANYPVVGDPDALFEDPSTWKAELLIAGLVKQMQANICYPKAGFYNFTDCKGKAYLKVDWQVYSRLYRKVVYETTTEGSGLLRSTLPGGDIEVFLRAFSMATQNLLADKGFRDLVVKPTQQLTQRTPEEIRIRLITESQEPLSSNINDRRAAVVTVFAGDGHGSGFFIASEGYLLTNEHVVRSARFVTLKLITGREIVGEVLRTDALRDVALIKAEDTDMAALPIRTSSLRVGDDIYVLGSPLLEEFNATLSKGVVSAFRIQDNQHLIQSDVNIQPGSSGGPLLDKSGNVAGITVSGILPYGLSTGLNFFIPIEDALKALNVAKPIQLSATGERLQTPTVTAIADSKQRPRLVVKGIAYSERNPSALVGTTIVHEGDTIDGVEVVKIRRDSVEFSYNGQTWTQGVSK